MELLHVRVICPPDRTPEVESLLTASTAVTDIVVLPGVARRPVGDLLQFDVVREGTSHLLDELREMGIDKCGSIAVEYVDTSLSATAEKAAGLVPGHGVDAVVWAEIEQKTGAEARLSGAYLAFMILASALCGIGVLLDQPILLIGAMVVGPEFGPLAALCVGVVQRRGELVRRALVALTVGFLVAAVTTVLMTWALDLMGLVDREMLLAERPLTDFIWRPDALSWIVALLAGTAGMLSLTSAKAGALVGVVISVTTIPAASNASVAIAYGVREEAVGSAIQLVINTGAIITAGVLTLGIQRWAGRQPPVGG